MGIARYKDLCIDTNTPGGSLGRFWASALGLRHEPDDDGGKLVGDVSEQAVWMNGVPEAKTAKNRVHLDIHARSVEEIVALGAEVLEPAEDFEGRGWSVLADPEGGEFCVFVRRPEALPSYRLYEIVVDSEAPRMIAAWWADMFGAKLGGDADQGWWLDDIPGAPFETMVFAPVPEPKTVKNRIHWDVTVGSQHALEELVSAGATLLRPSDDEIAWTVLADPEGNEFCAFIAD